MTGLQMGITIPDLEQVRRNFGDHAKVLDTELRSAETESLIVLRDAARGDVASFATDGRLSGSIRYEKISGGLTGVVGSVAATALSIEEGRKKGEVVGVGPLIAWMNRKGIVAPAASAAGARQNVRTHRLANPKAQGVARAQRDLAWKLRMAIIDHGTKPHPFIGPAVRPSVVSHVTAFFDAAVARALAKLVKR